MTTELEEQFFKVFGIKPDCTYLFLIDGDGENKAARTMSFGSKADLKRFVCECGGKGKVTKATDSPHIYYPEITDRKLLEMICIYNSFQNDEGSLLIPFDINNVKDIALQVITKSVEDKSLNNYYCNDVKKLKANIQQLFKEGE